jgi:hypothetical protein
VSPNRIILQLFLNIHMKSNHRAKTVFVNLESELVSEIIEASSTIKMVFLFVLLRKKKLRRKILWEIYFFCES